MEEALRVEAEVDNLLRQYDLACQLKQWKRAGEISQLIGIEIEKLEDNEIKLEEVLQ